MSSRQPHEVLATRPARTISELVPVGTSTIGGKVVQTTNARDLRAFLQIGKDFSAWVKTQIARARLVEGRDFVSSPSRGSSGQHTVEYHLTLEAGKHVAMLSETDNGFEVREYFIECERRALSTVPALPNFADPAAAARAWADEVEATRAAEGKVQQLEHKLADQAPAVAGFDLIASADGTLCIRDAAAALQMRQCDLTDYLISKAWIYERVGAEGYRAYRTRLQALDLKYKTFGYESKTSGERKVRQQVLITHKGLTTLAKLIASEAAEAKLAAATKHHQHQLSIGPE
ncbi:antA/AntB antirepressor family protein [Massilia pseudoviolaceinigra]|uniref:antA/AntB antirepressor family protein n=1 Tax=Massilia pseudoviolaceinigra TaxID=3057165 RepID=UPI002796B89F|nr:antA/AntB antirepressor family protein [Massilia sp. CCM 9206]MDQ1924698.1 antA/AntB antirepressor family protein [Massilia sp. CCM 9206]